MSKDGLFNSLHNILSGDKRPIENGGPTAVGTSAENGKVRLTWFTGEQWNFAPPLARRLANHLRNLSIVASDPKATGMDKLIPNRTFFASGGRLEVQFHPEGHYHEKRCAIIRFVWHDGSYLDILAEMGGAWAVGLDHYANEADAQRVG